MRKKIECAELLAADLFRNADQDRYRITLGCVEKYLAQLAMHPRHGTCGRCWMVSQVSAQRVFFVASAWQQEIRATRVRTRR